LFFKYPESPVVNVLGLNKVEVLAEKIRALSSRTKGRDLYDVWFLLKNGVTPDRELFARKMSIMNREPVVDLSVSEKDFVNDLRILLSRPPGYLSVRDHVRTELLRNGFALRE
jgi:predicted nucleotidyltransferase component of viral defense system